MLFVCAIINTSHHKGRLFYERQKIMLDNGDFLEDIDITTHREQHKEIEFLEEQTETDTGITEKDYITRNGKKYYKTKRAYIYKCEDGYYAYRIVHKPSKTNNFVNRHIDTKERFNTEYKAFQAQQEHIKRLDIDRTFKNRDITFEEVWNGIKEKAVKDPATIAKYESIYKHHVSFEFGNRPIQDIAYTDINDFLEKMYKLGDGRGRGQNGYSYTFTESILKFFWLVFQRAFAEKVISADDLKTILDNIKMPKKLEDKDIRILSTEEIQQVYDLLKDTDYLLVFLVSLYTGARPAESFAVRYSDFNLINNTLSINKQIVEFQGRLTFKEPKTFARVVNIPEELKKEVLRRQAEIERARQKDPALFELNRKKVVYDFKDNKGTGDIYDDMIMTDTSGRYNAYSSFQYYAKIIRKEICRNDDKREDFSFYSFRKTALSILASHNIPIGTLMKMSGHKKNETLFQYYYSNETEFSQKKVNEAITSLNTLIKK